MVIHQRPHPFAHLVEEIGACHTGSPTLDLPKVHNLDAIFLQDRSQPTCCHPRPAGHSPTKVHELQNEPVVYLLAGRFVRTGETPQNFQRAKICLRLVARSNEALEHSQALSGGGVFQRVQGTIDTVEFPLSVIEIYVEGITGQPDRGTVSQEAVEIGIGLSQTLLQRRP